MCFMLKGERLRQLKLLMVRWGIICSELLVTINRALYYTLYIILIKYVKLKIETKFKVFYSATYKA